MLIYLNITDILQQTYSKYLGIFIWYLDNLSITLIILGRKRAFTYLQKKTNKLESVLLAHEQLGKDIDSTSLDFYIYFHATNWLRYFIQCKHWQEMNINKMIPDE